MKRGKIICSQYYRWNSLFRKEGPPHKERQAHTLAPILTVVNESYLGYFNASDLFKSINGLIIFSAQLIEVATDLVDTTLAALMIQNLSTNALKHVHYYFSFPVHPIQVKRQRMSYSL